VGRWISLLFLALLSCGRKEYTAEECRALAAPKAYLDRCMGGKINGEYSGDEKCWPFSQPQRIHGVWLVNELVTNAAKHGAGAIDVTYTATDGRHRLVVCDEGPGLAPDFDPDVDRTSLGMRIISLLVKQLGGTMTAVNRPGARGACFTVTF
jgi:signal transduction histidine kinase